MLEEMLVLRREHPQVEVLLLAWSFRLLSYT